MNHVIKSPADGKTSAPRPRVTTSRVVVVETVYHHQHGGGATPIESRYSRPLATDEQLYSRQMKVGGEWVSLDGSWLREASLVVVRNERYFLGPDGEILQTFPTTEQTVEADSRVVEVVCVGSRSRDRDMFSAPVAADPGSVPPWLVFPGESMRATPSDVSSIRLRCRSGVARVVVNVVPS